MFRRSLIILSICLTLFCPIAAQAGHRVALVIGNADYSFAPLRNPVNDAQDITRALKDLGFQIILRQNASRRDILESVEEFAQDLSEA